MILIDSDVLIDDAVNRYPYSIESKEFLRRAEQTVGMVFVSWHSISNLYYIASKEHSDATTRQYILDLPRFARIAETNTEDLRYALDLDMRDFEDAMQVAAAQACSAEYIVTRNIVDFVNSPVRAIMPDEALSEIFQG